MSSESGQVLAAGRGGPCGSPTGQFPPGLPSPPLADSVQGGWRWGLLCKQVKIFRG